MDSDAFNHEDFEDNNPFAEPPPLLDTNPSSVEAPQSTEENVNNSVERPAHTSNDDISQFDDKEELKKLLPERFTKKYKIKLTLQEIEKNKESNPILRFSASVSGLPKFRQSEYKDVRRTYNEVTKFNKYLIISNLEVFVPTIPSSVTSYPHGGEEEHRQLMEVWQEWFDRITANPILIRDEEFVYFIENDFGYSVINSKRKQSVASGLVRKTLKQFTLPYDSYEELANFRPAIKTSYLACQKLHKDLDKYAKGEKLLSSNVGDLSSKMSQLSQFELVHPGMKNMWERLAKITSLQADLHLVQSVSIMGIIGDSVQTLANDFYEIKEALTNRHLIMREIIQAEAQTKTKHQQASKIKSKASLDPLKVDEAIRALEYASKTEESLKMQVKRISGEMLYEREEVLQHVDSKFKKVMKRFTLNKVEHHRKILKHLESIRLDVRIIDEKGGLSRLNRDNLSNLKHNLSQSQSSNGDSWSSRTFRSLSSKREDKNPKEIETYNVDAKNAASLLGVATF
ncbi:Piso0_001043 [Millerozyma farinosa CBS 7064]|uniref:Piso0_001043 protein n=1 Tax=Pichia sorbitophila (strain ATCC MYA-4447 / BCRC 22081 / CBS 7064 / NBRC 10061 / NRRL Y-12695) TaxID=559304 RepID=G8YS83_PICSO|nr:Piso0_001043 [Millerozyma farinosa CBS 7064]CCE79006.1 Piso0_001043 [Millerozyma farinosa CBS 7064]